jgi:hypothetical protein
VRRVLCVVAAGVLAVAGYSAVARAAALPNASDRFDLGSQLMLRLFGETSDASASFAAAQGDRTSESPLRNLALQFRTPAGKPDAGDAVGGAFAQEHLTLRDLSAVSSSSFASDVSLGSRRYELQLAPESPGYDAIVRLPTSALFTAAYQPEPPAPNISPAPGTLAFAPSVKIAGGFLTGTTQVGAVRFDSHDDTAATQRAQLDTRDATYGAGANFDVRAGKRNLSVNLSSEYEHVAPGSNDALLSPGQGSSAWQLPGSGAPVVVPGYADLDRLSLGAGLSVPVVRGLTLNLNYDAQRLNGGFGFPGLMNLDTLDNSYGGRLTFDIPKMSSSLSISAYQDRLDDGFLQLNGSTQTREDVNFTVKF